MSENEKIAILKEVLGQPSKEGDAQLLFHCPKCDHHKKKLSINLEKGYFKCWVCDWSGRNLYRIVRRHGDYNQKQHWKRLTQQIEITNFAEILFGENPVIEKKQKIELPHSFVSLVNRNLPNTASAAINYLENRGVKKGDIFKWKIGYCSSGEYASRIVIPSFDLGGDINYFIGRTYSGDWLRYTNPKISKDIIFNHLYLDFDEPLTLVEGVFDAIKAGENSVPLLGSTLTENSSLFMEIVKNDTPIYLALDSDADKKTNKLIKLFLKYDIELYNIDIDPYSDVGEMTSEEFACRKDSAAVLDLDNYLLNRIRSI